MWKKAWKYYVRSLAALTVLVMGSSLWAQVGVVPFENFDDVSRWSPQPTKIGPGAIHFGVEGYKINWPTNRRFSFLIFEGRRDDGGGSIKLHLKMEPAGDIGFTMHSFSKIIPVTSTWTRYVVGLNDFRDSNGNPPPATHAIWQIHQTGWNKEMRNVMIVPELPTGISLIRSTNEFNIFTPGQALNFELDLYNATSSGKSTTVTWKVFKYSGAQIRSGQFSQSFSANEFVRKPLNMSGLASGYYVLEVRMAGGGTDLQRVGLVVLPERPNRAPARPFFGFAYHSNTAETAARLWMHRMDIGLGVTQMTTADRHLAVAVANNMTPVGNFNLTPTGNAGIYYSINSSSGKKEYDIPASAQRIADLVNAKKANIKSWMLSAEANAWQNTLHGGIDHYIEMVQAGADAIRANDAQAKVQSLGFTASDAFNNYATLEYCWNQLRPNTLDGAFVNNYTHWYVGPGWLNKKPEINLERRYNRLLAIMGQNANIGTFEQGYIYLTELALNDSWSRMHAQFSVRHQLLSSGFPQSKLHFIFRMKKHTANSYWGFYRKNGHYFSPPPVIATVATAARMLYDAENPRKIARNDDVYAYSYKEGSGSVAVIWTDETTAVNHEFPGDFGFTVTNADGAPISVSGRTINITNNPIYIKVPTLSQDELDPALEQDPEDPTQQEEGVWEPNDTNNKSTNIPWDFAMGYHFTPLVDGSVTSLAGYFNGTKTVKLFRKSDGALLATKTITSSNQWSRQPISAVPVQANTTYTVCVYLAGSGGVYEGVSPVFPRTFGEVRIEGTTYIDTRTNANARPTNTLTGQMYGQVDIGFTAGNGDPDPPQPQTPWSTNESGMYEQGQAWRYSMGYHFTPLKNGTITEVGGKFGGTKKIKIFDRDTGQLLRVVWVTPDNYSWTFQEMVPLSVTANKRYTICVYLAGWGGAVRRKINFPQTHGDIRIDASTYASTATNLGARPTNSITFAMYGMVDIKFLPE